MRFITVILILAVAAAQAPREAAPRHDQDAQTTALNGVENDERSLKEDCGGCDYMNDPICKLCLQDERLNVVCGECLYTNECFARESGKEASECKIVGADP